MRRVPIRPLLRALPLVTASLLLAGCPDEDRELGAGVADAGVGRGPVIAKCAVTLGEVQVRRAGSTGWTAITAGAEFQRGDLVRTGKESFVSIRFSTGGGFDLEENGLMVISVKPGAVAEAAAGAAPKKPVDQPMLALESGVGRGYLEEAEELLAPLVIREDDGTEVALASVDKQAVSFRLSKTRRGTEIAVAKGRAVLKTKGRQVRLEEGQAADVVKGGGVSEVVELLDFPASLAPGVDARFHCAADLSVKLAWAKVPKAAGYRVQVARDLAFQAVVTTLEVGESTTTFAPPGAGTYAWRVAAKDGQERVGEYGFARRIFCEQEEPRDLLLAPEHATTYAYDETRAPVITFSWQSAANSGAYRLVVAKQPDLLAEPAVVDRIVTDQRVEIGDLEVGDYFWGVYLDGATPVPVFTSPRKVAVVKSLKTRFQTPKSLSNWGKRK